jgi:hypothetical protein
MNYTRLRFGRFKLASRDEPRSLQKCQHRALDVGEWRVGQLWSGYPDKIPAGRDLREQVPHCLAEPPAGKVAANGVADFLAGDEAASGRLGAIAGGVQNDKSASRATPFAPDPLELRPGAKCLHTLC